MTKLREDYFLGLGLKYAIGDEVISSCGASRMGLCSLSNFNAIDDKSHLRTIESFAWRELSQEGFASHVDSIEPDMIEFKKAKLSGFIEAWRFKVDKLIEMQIAHDAGADIAIDVTEFRSKVSNNQDLEKDIAMILLDYEENDLGTLSTARRIAELINKAKL